MHALKMIKANGPAKAECVLPMFALGPIDATARRSIYYVWLAGTCLARSKE